ncbi:LysM peptidoglycan-binding domain-containing protein [Nocardioides pinisoli]|uniref:LysM peptidoglycan-binding domain-containing protein n=1 Tax=Nocardioides pinisoli TaxID=2950279 RepID=A0ABT1KX50_9ACTN|nr:LysM peptidoglycan-binding domain-containing protein [Nocardioides pinisoli]MCP3422338.1 LysM peptidoglycan-binding domain-containing protein [Nocardioides pinisoli]
MSRGMLTACRPYAVWAGVTAVAAAAAASVPAAWREATHASAHERVPDVLVAGCATLLALSLGWLWLVTSVTVAELVAGRVPRGAGGATRRLVLLACGAAVVAGAALPAHASGGDGAEVLVGLPLPERAVAPATTPAITPAVTPVSPTPVLRTTGDTHVVREGDSLWSIARAHPAPGVGVDERWRAIWRHNRDVVGDDPDVIHPGQALRLPADPPTDPATHTEKDGEPR